MEQVEGVDYTPDGIRALREDCIRIRNESVRQWAADPSVINFTVLMTHVIAHLSNYAEMVEAAEKARRSKGADRGKGIAEPNLVLIDEVAHLTDKDWQQIEGE